VPLAEFRYLLLHIGTSEEGARLELLATRARDMAGFPSTEGAPDPLWWTPVWEASPGIPARLGPTHLACTDLDFSRRMFEGVLGEA
jgi:hypothetical protein